MQIRVERARGAGSLLRGTALEGVGRAAGRRREGAHRIQKNEMRQRIARTRRHVAPARLLC